MPPSEAVVDAEEPWPTAIWNSCVKPVRSSFFLLPIIYLGFVSLGLPDGTLGVAWPPIYQELDLPIGLAGTILTIATVLAGIAALSSGRIVSRIGTGPLVLMSCIVTGSGLMIIAHAKSLVWLLAAAVPLGLGAGAVDAALNGYVARHYTARHMNWLHACWGIGATLGPIVMAQALASAHGWRGGYFGLSIAQLSLAVLFLFTLRLWDVVPVQVANQTDRHSAGRIPTATANSPAGWWSVGIFALYLGVETMTGLWSSSILVVSRGFTPEKAAVCGAAYYGAITVGRILVGFVVERFGNRAPIAAGLAISLVGALLFVVANTLSVAAIALILLGLGFAPVYPCLMHEVPRRFVPDAVQTVIGRQSGAGGIGAALLPAAVGALAGLAIEGIAWAIVVGVVGLVVTTVRLNRLA